MAIQTTNKPTAENAHKMLISTGFGVFFVVIATLIAGINGKAASAMIALMIIILLIQALANVDLFAAFVEKSTFTPSKQ